MREQAVPYPSQRDTLYLPPSLFPQSAPTKLYSATLRRWQRGIAPGSRLPWRCDFRGLRKRYHGVRERRCGARRRRRCQTPAKIRAALLTHRPQDRGRRGIHSLDRREKTQMTSVGVGRGKVPTQLQSPVIVAVSGRFVRSRSVSADRYEYPGITQQGSKDFHLWAAAGEGFRLRRRNKIFGMTTVDHQRCRIGPSFYCKIPSLLNVGSVAWPARATPWSAFNPSRDRDNTLQIAPRRLAAAKRFCFNSTSVMRNTDDTLFTYSGHRQGISAMMVRLRAPFLVLAIGLLGFALLISARTDVLSREFTAPPPAARLWVYWYIMDGHLTHVGIHADMEAMQKVGIGGCDLPERRSRHPAWPRCVHESRIAEPFRLRRFRGETPWDTDRSGHGTQLVWDRRPVGDAGTLDAALRGEHGDDGWPDAFQRHSWRARSREPCSSAAEP